MSLERHPMVDILIVDDLADSLHSCPACSYGVILAEESTEEPPST